VTTSSDRHQKQTTKTGSLEPDQLDWAAQRGHWNMLVGNVLVKMGLKRWDRTSGQSFLRWMVTRSSHPASSGAVSNGKKLPLKISWSPSAWACKLSGVLSMRLPQDPPLYWRYVACRCGHPEDSLYYTDRSAPLQRHRCTLAVAKNFATLHECKQKIQKSNEIEKISKLFKRKLLEDTRPN